ncbi:hypothetical protein [Nocardia pneumoniae]|uniref:hypothetical protein n=1 Tax=Nocardia pneumoniae TaxID=228601 RepID=UPI0012F6C7FD|nr:hypothetical protein [Nocardia pneumoniae]
MRPTPWQIREARYEQADSAGGTQRSRWNDARLRAVVLGKRLRTASDGNWGHLSAAVGCVITFALLFQPWLTTNTGGTDGTIHANAFGRLQVTTFWVDLWARSSVPSPKASGAWGILTSVAICVAVCSVAANLLVHAKALRHLSTAATVFVAVFTIATALYLNSKGDELTRVVSYGTARDPGTQIGLLLRWARGHDNYPAPGFLPVSYATASLTWSAILACAISLASAIAAVAQRLMDRMAADDSGPTNEPLANALAWARPRVAHHGEGYSADAAAMRHSRDGVR